MAENIKTPRLSSKFRVLIKNKTCSYALPVGNILGNFFVDKVVFFLDESLETSVDLVQNLFRVLTIRVDDRVDIARPLPLRNRLTKSSSFSVKYC